MLLYQSMSDGSFFLYDVPVWLIRYIIRSDQRLILTLESRMRIRRLVLFSIVINDRWRRIFSSGLSGNVNRLQIICRVNRAGIRAEI